MLAAFLPDDFFADFFVVDFAFFGAAFLAGVVECDSGGGEAGAGAGFDDVVALNGFGIVRNPNNEPAVSAT